MEKVRINTNRRWFTQYNGKVGVFKEIVERTNVNGYFYIVEVDDQLLKLYESDFEWLEKEKKSSNFVKNAENDLTKRIISSSKEDRQKVLSILKNEYKKYTGIKQMAIAQSICQLELMEETKCSN